MRQRTELSSWKEIADRLDVSVRTAQLWEKDRGLPVRRLPGSRGRVFVRVDEIETWLLTEKPSLAPAPAISTSTVRGIAVSVVVSIAVAALVAAAAARAGDRRRLADARVVGNELIAIDQAGRELWRREFPEGLYRAGYRAGQPMVQVVDLVDDGSPEILFTYAPDVFDESWNLVCYSVSGEELWRFDPTAQQATSTEEFHPAYRISNATVADLGDGRTSIVFVAFHYLQYPTRVVVISLAGVVRADYWHAGQIGAGQGQLRLADLDEDGSQEIYLSGVNNARDQATLVVLDPFSMRGAGVEENPEYQFLGQEPGNERARVFFPRSGLTDQSYRYNAAQFIAIQSDSLLIEVAEAIGHPGQPTVMYQLDRSLRARKIMPSDTYIGAHRKLYLAGQLSRSVAGEEAYLVEEFGALRQSAEPKRSDRY